jgi:hypothetical protein
LLLLSSHLLAEVLAAKIATGMGGIAFGALLHNTAVAIVTYFVLGGALSLLMIPALQAAGNWVNTGWVLYGQWAGHGAQTISRHPASTAPPTPCAADQAGRRGRLPQPAGRAARRAARLLRESDVTPDRVRFSSGPDRFH